MLLHRDELGNVEPVLTLTQAAAALGCNRTTLWRNVCAGKLSPPIEISPGRIGWPSSVIDAWKARRAGPPADPAAEHGADDPAPTRMDATCSDVAVYAHPSILQAIESGRFPGWFADLWINNGFADAYGCDRRWLEGFGRRVEAAMRGDPETREDRLQDVMRWLVKECRRGTHTRGVEFMLQWASRLHMDAVHARNGPSWDAKLARAFGAAVAAIRRARDGARKAGVEPDRLDEVDLKAVAEIVSRQVLRGEGVSCTDVLTAIKVHTAVVPLAEWIGEAPTDH